MKASTILAIVSYKGIIWNTTVSINIPVSCLSPPFSYTEFLFLLFPHYFINIPSSTYLIV